MPATAVSRSACAARRLRSAISRDARKADRVRALTPPASLRRSTARPPTARPSASIGWPDSVVSVIVKASPRARNASTACSMSRALLASSQLPESEQAMRRGAMPRMAGSPSMPGSLDAAGQSTMICGSDRQQRIGAIDLARARRQFRRAMRLQPRRARVRAQQHDRRNHGEQYEPEHRHQDRNFVPVDVSGGADHSLARDKKVGVCWASAGTGNAAATPANTPAVRNPPAADEHSPRSSGSSPACPLPLLAVTAAPPATYPCHAPTAEGHVQEAVRESSHFTLNGIAPKKSRS